MTNSTMKQRPTFTPPQVQQYFDTIELPAKYRAFVDQSLHPSISSSVSALDFLTAVIRYQITRIPWENLELHYSTNHTITLDPPHVFGKLVDQQHGRGGYCMENAQLLATVLRSVGFDVMPVGARVNTAIQPESQDPSWPGPSFGPWYHMLLIVKVNRKKYVVDIGLGSYSPTFPLPLEDGFVGVNIAPSQEVRLSREFIPDNSHTSDAEQQLWVYSLRLKKDGPWIPGYCFNETEFLQQDFEMMNFFVSQSSKTWFSHHIVCLKFLMDKETEEIIGHITLFDREINERVDGVSRKVASVTSEAERVHAMRHHLGVTLTDPERSGIGGLVSMID